MAQDNPAMVDLYLKLCIVRETIRELRTQADHSQLSAALDDILTICEEIYGDIDSGNRSE